jgi:hypothetical protein
MKLDRSYFKAGNINDKKRQVDEYAHLSEKEQIELFNYLMSKAFDFQLGKFPKMDKTAFSCRKIKTE